MIDKTTLLLFLAAAWSMILIPGPDILYVLARGFGGGRRAGVVSGLGVGMGEVIHTLLAVGGLGAILATSLTAFLMIKYLGAIYLVFLGIRTIRDKQVLTLPSTSTPIPLMRAFWQGMLTNLLNPKAVLFFVAFLPQFVNPTHGQAQFQIGFLGILFALSDLLFLSVLAYSTGFLHTWITRNARFTAQLRWISGSILVGLGIRLAVTERR